VALAPNQQLQRTVQTGSWTVASSGSFFAVRVLESRRRIQIAFA
jgi:hypothetical protein